MISWPKRKPERMKGVGLAISAMHRNRLSKKYLNRPSPVLLYLNRAVFPYFIIHQTIIVVLGYWMVQLNQSILVKFILLSTLSTFSILFVYHFIIKRTRLTRILYGMNDSLQAIVVIKMGIGECLAMIFYLPSCLV